MSVGFREMFKFECKMSKFCENINCSHTKFAPCYVFNCSVSSSRLQVIHKSITSFRPVVSSVSVNERPGFFHDSSLKWPPGGTRQVITLEWS